MPTWIFIDLDQCCNMACQIHPDKALQVYCFARNAYTGPVPVCGEMVYAPSNSSQAADNMFYFTLGRLIYNMSPADTVLIVSADRDWSHAVYILRSMGIDNACVVNDVKGLLSHGVQMMSPENVASHALGRMRSGRN